MTHKSVRYLIILLAAAAVVAAASTPWEPLNDRARMMDPSEIPEGARIQDRPENPSEVILYSGPAVGLPAKVEWAVREAGKSHFEKGFWVGYSIRRVMGENSHIGTFDSHRLNQNLTIEEVLSGRRSLGRAETDGEVVRRTARRILDELEGSKKEETKVQKDLGFFFLYGPGSSPAMERARMSNLDLSFEFLGLPLFWLGESAEKESLTVIGDLFAKAKTDKIKKGLVASAGVHGDSSLAVPFLEKVLTGTDSDDVRKDAAFWLGQQHDKAALGILVRTVKSDPSRAVRKNAVFSISQTDLPEAVDELITLAKSAEGIEVKKEAVFWLGQIASKKAGAALEEFATRDDDTRIQEHAVFALTQLPDGGGVEPLIRIAKTHPDPRVRKRAVFWLGECNDPRALQTLIEIVKK